MIQVSESWVRPFNIGVIVFMLIMVIAGYRKGVIKQLVELLGTLFSAWVSYWGSSVLSEYFQLAPKAFTPLQGTIFGDAVYQYFNEMVWFLLLFLICRVALGFICHAATSARNMPFISTAGGIIGAVLGLLSACVWIVLLSFVLQMPIFKDGSIVTQGTVIKPVVRTVGAVFNEYVAPVVDIEAFNQLKENAEDLTERQKNMLKEWLEKNGYESVERNSGLFVTGEYYVC